MAKDRGSIDTNMLSSDEEEEKVGDSMRSFDLESSERTLPKSDDEDILGRTLLSNTFDDEDDEIDSDFEILPDDEDDDAAYAFHNSHLAKVEEETEGGNEEGTAKIIGTPEHSPRNSPDGSPERSPRRKDPKAPKSPKSPSSIQKRRFNLLPQSMEKALRAYKAKGEAKDNENWEHGAPDETEGFSSDDSFFDHDSSIGEDSKNFEDDADQHVDFSTLSILPNSFLSAPPAKYDYLDPELVKFVDQQDISKFAWEHHLLTKGLIQLLTERDHIGVEGDIHDSSNVLKMGPLKKRYAQKLWSVKYVEIRKGNLTYYGDKAMQEGKNNRRIIHLRKRTCRCEALAKTKDGFMFALFHEGGPKRVWMAKSEEERDGWMRVINQAMIGETDEADDFPLNLTLYKNAMEEYSSVRNYLRDVDTRKDYMLQASTLLYRQSTSSALRVPMKWIRDEILQEKDDDAEEKDDEKKRDSPHQRVKSAVSNFWNTLCNASIVLNGYLIEANSAYSGERVIGSLSRCILEFDKVEKQVSHLGSMKSVKRVDVDSFLTELEAVTHARSILAGILRSKNRNETLSVVEELFRNDHVVSSIEVKHLEPLHIDVSFAGDDFSEEYEPEPNDLSGWLPSKTKNKTIWKERYFVLSEGVLSFYLEANPRPFGLRGQFVLKDAKIESVDGVEGKMLEIRIKDHQRQLLFEDRAQFIQWKSIIERTRDSNLSSSAFDTEELDSTDDETKKKPSRGPNRFQKRAQQIQKEAKEAMKEAKHAGMNSIKKRSDKMKDASEKIARRFKKKHRPARRRPTNDMVMTSTRTLQSVSAKRDPTVQVVVELNNVYQVTTKNKDDEEGQGVLMDVKVKHFQAFLLSGGPNGRLARGDELLEMKFSEGDSPFENTSDPKTLEAPTSL